MKLRYILQLISSIQCKFYSGNVLTGFPALYCNAWKYSFDCQYTCASNGRWPSKSLPTISNFDFFIESLLDGLDLCSNAQYTEFTVNANRVIKPVLFKHCSLWLDWTHCFKRWLGRGFQRWWVHHLLTSYLCWQ